MKIECIQETINNLPIPMLSIDGELYIFQNSLSAILGVSGDRLRMCRNRYPKWFGSLRVTDCSLKKFLKQNKAFFGIQRARGNIRLWSEDDMLSFAFLIHGKECTGIHKEMKELIKRHAVRHVITPEQFVRIEQELNHYREANNALLLENRAFQARLKKLEEEIGFARPFLEEIAKLSGKSLYAQRGTKSIRQKGLPN